MTSTKEVFSGSLDITIDKIVHDHKGWCDKVESGRCPRGPFVVHVAGRKLVDGNQKRAAVTVECEPKDFQSFGAFQRRMADAYGVWIDHHSQDSSAKYRASEWNRAIADAFDRGAE